MNAITQDPTLSHSPKPNLPSPAPANSKRKRTEPKFYAVRKGGKPGIYNTYDECLAQVKGHKGAIFKSFTTQSEAEAFINNHPSALASPNGPSKYYAVRNGWTPGIYRSWDLAAPQIQGFSKPKHKSFSTRAEAESFMEEGSTTVNGDDPSPKKQRKSSNGQEDQAIEPGYGPPPPGSEDNFDSSIILNAESGRVEYKTEQQRNAVKMQATGPSEDAVLVIHTDGSSLGNGQAMATAGVGVYFGPVDSRNVSEGLKGARQTNQRAELTAVQRAIDIAPKDRHILIRTDSKYSIDCLTDWFVAWRDNGWMTASKKPVENRDLIEPIINKIDERHRLRVKTNFEWTKGHADDPGNVAADKLAVEGARQARLEQTLTKTEDS